ncbi:MAG: murein biosynthesis integral membrane protein MurJ [Candidatus Puniceispirillum sp.]|nr:murein biosynthesis integral membrane protein MurJ [Candidatus Pelagibacter sp.]MBA4282669.1 murein biosynthesis integral membrane protein MurJ [Candidatus Puniceispirillum sp.]
MNLIKTVSIISGWTAISRILGMAREMLMTYYFGVGFVSDAFIVAFKLPNFFRRFLADGAFSSILVPEYSRRLSKDPPHVIDQFKNNIFTHLLLFLTLLVLCVEIFAPYVVRFIAPGMDMNPQQSQIVTEFIRINFPFIMFIALSTFYASLLNSHGHFSTSSALPVVLNIVMVAGLCLPASNTLTKGYIVSWSVMVAGILQLVWVFLRSYHIKINIKLVKPVIDPGFKVFIKKLLPSMFGAGVMQINLLIDIQLASYLGTGALSYLYYADRLYQLPLSMFGIAIGTSLLPYLTKLWANNRGEDVYKVQNQSLILVLFLNIPAAIGLIVLAQPIIELIYGRGSFSAFDVTQTYKVLQAYALGLPAYVCSKIFLSTFYSLGDTKTPFKIAGISVLSNFIFNIILMNFLGFVGLALATSITAYIQTFLLGHTLTQHQHLKIQKKLWVQVGKILFLGLLMGLGVHYFYIYMHGIVQKIPFLISISGSLSKIGLTFFSIGFGLGIYMLCSSKMGFIQQFKAFKQDLKESI